MKALQQTDVAPILERAKSTRILVVGDLIADRYIFAKPSRLSREAPVIVALHERESLIPGGAANAAANLMALGVEVVPVGVVGRDVEGRGLIEHFAEHGVDTSGIQVVLCI